MAQRGIRENAPAPIRHSLAVLMMVGCSTIMSLSGLLVRNLHDATDWQIVFWRGIALAAAMFLLLVIEHRGATLREMRRIGWSGVLGGLFFSGTIMGFVLSLTHTTVANTVFTMSAIPFFTAVLAWLVLGERVSRATVFAILAAAAGIALMVGDGLAEGSVFGNLMAILTALCFACFIVILRKGRAVNMLPSIIVAALVASAVAIGMTGGDLALSLHDLVLCLIWGAGISGTSYFLMVRSSRRLQGVELTLLVLLEFILAPVWVYVFVDEVPATRTLAGGLVVLTAVMVHALVTHRKLPVGMQ